jgi:hypothetical protein
MKQKRNNQRLPIEPDDAFDLHFLFIALSLFVEHFLYGEETRLYQWRVDGRWRIWTKANPHKRSSSKVKNRAKVLILLNKKNRLDE